MCGEVKVERSWLAIGRRGVWVYCLRVNGSPPPRAMIEAIPEEVLGGEPLGWVSLHWPGCGDLGMHLHLLRLNRDSQLRLSTVKTEPCWSSLRHLYLGD